MKSIMKKLLVLVSAALLLAGLSTSCNKTSNKEECMAKEAELNEEWGANVVKCKQ